jgi:hypothetical protein
MMELEWPRDARNCLERWSAYPIPNLVKDSIAANPGHGHFIPVGWLCSYFLLHLMRLTHCGLGESHTLKLPCEGINFDGVGIFL